MSDTSTPAFLQGVHAFNGTGLVNPVPLPDCRYVVPSGVTAQPLYFRGGNSSDALVYVALVRDGMVMRLFPIGARASTHVSLRVVEDVVSDSALELHVAAPDGVSGEVVVDLGVVQF